MTRKEAERLTAQENTLMNLGFTRAEAEQLRRISMTLHRWHELECGDGSGCLASGRLNGHEFEYDDNGDPFWEYAGQSGAHRYSRIPDREKGARKHLHSIIAARNARDIVIPDLRAGTFSTYIQGDPRGAALYIIRPGDVPDGRDVQSYYDRGICVY